MPPAPNVYNHVRASLVGDLGAGEGRRENNANTIPYPVGCPHESRLRLVVYRAIFGGLLPKGAGRSESGEDQRDADSVVQREVERERAPPAGLDHLCVIERKRR